jgi:DNA-directed RNA polymerase subunit RPC12/RpoP
MEIERCNSASCRRPFQVLELGPKMPGTKESEDITCPYCSYTIQRTSNGWFQTIALSPNQEKVFIAENPL